MRCDNCNSEMYPGDDHCHVCGCGPIIGPGPDRASDDPYLRRIPDSFDPDSPQALSIKARIQAKLEELREKRRKRKERKRTA